MTEQGNASSGGLVQRGSSELALAVGANPLVARGLACLAEVHLRIGSEISRSVFAQALSYFNRGVDWLKQGDFDQLTIAFDEAIRLFDETIRLDDDNAFAYFFRSEASLWVGLDSAEFRQRNLLDRIRKARANIRRTVPQVESSGPPVGHPASAFHPDYAADAYTFSGKFWLDRNDYDKAAKHFDQAIRLDPENGNRYYTHGKYWLDMNEYDKAIIDLTQAIALAPQASCYYQARSLASLGKKDVENVENAAADFEQALYLDADHAFAIRWMALLIETCSEEIIRDAKQVVQEASRARQPNNSKTGWELNALAEAYADAGQFEEAQWYQAAALETPVGSGWLEAQFRRRLENYKQRMRWRDNPRY